MNEPQREMTLSEYINVLPNIHRAHKEMAELVKALHHYGYRHQREVGNHEEHLQRIRDEADGKVARESLEHAGINFNDFFECKNEDDK